MTKPTLVLILPALAAMFMYCKSNKKSTASAETTPAPVAATTPTPAANAEADLQMQIVQTRWPGSTIEDVKEGHTIFTTKCTTCHKAYSIPRFSEFKWLHEIDDMSPKAKLTADEKLKLTKYVLSYRETKEKMKGS